MTPARCLLLVLSLTLSVMVQGQDNPLDINDPFAGLFCDEAGVLKLELIAAPQSGEGRYRGVIRRGEKSFPLLAMRQGEAIEGTFRSGNSEFAFTAIRTTDGLKLSSGQATYQLRRQAGLEPPAPAAESSRARESGRVYRHPTGGCLRYPDGWTVRETPEGILLVAPQQQQDEVYLVTSEDAGGATRPDDPALLQKIDALVAQQLPLLRRDQQILKQKSGDRDGVVLTWQGTGPTGVKVKALLYATILKGHVVSIVAIGGATERIAPREPVLAQIFSTFSWGEAQLDPSLAGTWHYWSYSSSGLGGPNLSSTEIRRTLVLNHDGSFTMTGNTESYISVKSEDAQAASAAQRAKGLRGTWAAGGGSLFLTCEGGTYFSFGYRIQGQAGNRVLNLDTGSGKPQEWLEKPIN